MGHQRYVLSKDSIVKDLKTGLEWQRAPIDRVFTIKELVAYTLGMEEGWRVPTIEELLSLVDYTRFNPALDTTIFSNTRINSLWYWSSTRVAMDSGYVWGVGFFDGSVYNESADKLNRVRFVRTPLC